MNVTYEVFIALNRDGKPLPGVSEFVEKFAQFRTAQTGNFSFPDKETARQAIAMANDVHLEPQLLYFFHVDPEAIPTGSVFYFAVDVEEDILEPGQVQSQLLTDVEVAIDLCYDVVLVNERLKDLLERNASGLQFNAIEEKGWFRLDGISELPEPIVVPKTIYLSPNENPPGTWAVQSDGRDVLTQANVAWVHKHGLAVSHEVKTPADRLAWRPRVVISGSLLALLWQEKISGLASLLTPLLIEQDALDVELD